MKKLLLTTAGIALLSASSAFAQIGVNVDIGIPAPVYVAPAPVVMVGQPPVVINDAHHRHRADDWRYWQEQKERASWERSHPGGHWDHDGWARQHR